MNRGFEAASLPRRRNRPHTGPASATPRGAWTTTTPAGSPKREPKKNLGEILAAHGIPYFATASVAFPEDFVRKFRRARSVRGFRAIHVLAPCTPGWRYEERRTVELARLAVLARIFPLYEVEEGDRYAVSHDAPLVPVREFLEKQGRFAHLSPEEVDSIQREVDREWDRLVRRAGSVAIG